ncbi:MAG: hypothetical protein OEW26_09535 [Nitrospirota bacterium]|jgi:hypothetical protein|nr:hypothetical protein [Nitrospirota bacterium]
MTESQSFWPVECAQGEPDLFVCLTCFDEVFKAKMPVDGCPSCGAIAAFEPFSMDAIREWGTENLIQKAEQLPSSSSSSKPGSDQTTSSI